MITLNIDISILAINRTAMFFIVQDTIRYLSSVDEYDLNLIAMGEKVDWTSFIANDFELSPQLQDRSSQKLRKLVESPSSFQPARVFSTPNSVNLSFDPLDLFFLDLNLKTIVYILDLSVITRPNWHAPGVSQAYRRALQKLYHPNIHMASISQSTTRELWANCGISRNRVQTILLYNRFSSQSNITRQPQKQFLFVGSSETRKNVLALVRGFVLSDIAQQGYSLRIVGTLIAHGAQAHINQIIQSPGVSVLGRISDEALRKEYAHCCCLAYPSLWEGFGMPAIEALGEGIPLMLSDTGALPEVGGKFATYVDPCNIHSISAGFVKMADQLQKQTTFLDEDELSCWLTQFEFNRYAKELTQLIERINGKKTCSPSKSENFFIDQSKSSQRSFLNVGRKSTKSTTIASAWILPTHKEVKGDSFSLEYMYCIQQERRLVLSRTIANFMTCKIWMYPVYIYQLMNHFIRLKLTNAQVTSIVNEMAIQKLKNLEK